jgi:two-component system, response regulator
MEKEIEILLVEDNMDDAGLTIRSLKKRNLANRLLHLRDGEEALDYLFSVNNPMPKLILLDLKMPKINGIDVLRRIKADEEKRVIPVVMMTSSSEEKDIVESYKLGVNAYIVKPVDFEKFANTVADIGFFWLVLNQPST